MIDGLPPYPKMKPSGIELLGDVPTHWSIRRLGHIGRFLKGSGGTKDNSLPSGIPCVRYGDLYTTHSFFVRRARTHLSDERAPDYTPIEYGDVLFAASGETIDDIGRSAVNLIEGVARCGGDVIILRPTREMFAPFLGYATDCRPAAVQKARMGRGSTIKHIYPDELKQVLIGLPPLDEQRLIVRFLNWHGTQTAKLISAKKKTIALLNERKQAIIRGSVTRGLDPNVKLKPSGIPRLGDVPEGWQVTRLRNVAELRVSNVDKKSLDGEQPVRLCNYVDVYKNNVIHADIPFMRATASKAEIKQFRLRIGDVIITKDSEDWKDIGVPALVGTEADDLVCGYHLALLRPSATTDGAFLYWRLLSPDLRWQFAVAANGVTRYGLSHGSIKELALSIPDLTEQRAVAARLDAATANIRRMERDIQRELTLIQEFRTRLVADVVTGKLDVREIATALPEAADFEPIGEPADLEELDESVSAEDEEVAA